MHTDNLQKVCRRNTGVRGEGHFKTTEECHSNHIWPREHIIFFLLLCWMYPPTTFALGPIRKPYHVHLHHYLNLDRLCLHILKRITPKIIKSNPNSDSKPFRLSLFTFALFKKGRAEITIVPPYKGCGEADDKWGQRGGCQRVGRLPLQLPQALDRQI